MEFKGMVQNPKLDSTKKERNAEHCERGAGNEQSQNSGPFGWSCGVASIPVVAEAERQSLVIRMVRIVVATMLTVVVTLYCGQFLAVLLAVLESR